MAEFQRMGVETNPDKMKKNRNRKRLMIVVTVLVALALVVLLVWFLLNQLYFKNPRLILQNLQVCELVASDRIEEMNQNLDKGSPHFSLEKVAKLLRQCQVTVGTANLLTLDLKGLRQHLSQSPWVEEVQLYRIYPGTLRIGIRERKPVAVTILNRQYYCYIDGHGVLFPVENQGDVYKSGLPQINGIPQLEKMKQGVPLADEGIQAVVAMCKVYQSQIRDVGFGYHIASVVFDPPHHRLVCLLRPTPDNKTLQATTAKGSKGEILPMLILPSDVERMEKSFLRLDLIMREKASRSEIIHYIDLTPEENTYTRP